jgi:carbon-monoxide dehydrogenase small subunit
LLDHDPQPDDQSIREALAGHLCRCTGYSKMVEAVQDAAGMLREGERVPQGGAS